MLQLSVGLYLCFFRKSLCTLLHKSSLQFIYVNHIYSICKLPQRSSTMHASDLTRTPSIATNTSERNSPPASSHPDSLQSRFETLEAATSHTRAAANTYLASHPGPESIYCNTTLHLYLDLLLKNQLHITCRTLTYILKQLSYRTTLMATATEFLIAAGIALPKMSVEDFVVRDRLRHARVSRK